MGLYEDTLAQTTTGLLDRRRATAPTTPYVSQPLAPAPAPDYRNRLTDLGVSAVSGAIGLSEVPVGLADLATGGQVGKFLEENTPYQPKKAKEILGGLYSDKYKAEMAEVQNAPGFLGKVSAALQNPAVPINTLVESAPSILGAGGVGRGVLKLAPKAPGWIAGALGEGITAAGQGAEQVRQETPDKLLSGRQSLTQAASGGLTAAISGVSGGLAKKLGFADIETLLAGGGGPTGKVTKAIAARGIAGATLTESVFEELPQSAQEQVAQNLSLGKPWNDGVEYAAAMGAVSGGAMGFGAGTMNTSQRLVLQHLADKADKAKAPVADSPTPRADALLAQLAPPAPEAAPAEVVAPAAPEPVADAENFPGATDSLIARRQAAEQAAAPFVNPYANLAPARQPEFVATESDATPLVTSELAPAQTQEEARRESTRRFEEINAADPNGWRRAMNVAAQQGRSGHENRLAAIEEYERASAELFANPPAEPAPGAYVPADTVDADSDIRRAVDSGLTVTPVVGGHAVIAAPDGSYTVADSTFGYAVEVNIPTLAQALDQAEAYGAAQTTPAAPATPAVPQGYDNSEITPEENDRLDTHITANPTGAVDMMQDIRTTLAAQGIPPAAIGGSGPLNNALRREMLRRYENTAPANPAAPVYQTPEEHYAAFAANPTDSAVDINRAYDHFAAQSQSSRDPQFLAAQEVGREMRAAGIDTSAPAHRTEFERRAMERFLQNSQAPANQLAPPPASVTIAPSVSRMTPEQERRFRNTRAFDVLAASASATYPELVDNLLDESRMSNTEARTIAGRPLTEMRGNGNGIFADNRVEEMLEAGFATVNEALEYVQDNPPTAQAQAPAATPPAGATLATGMTQREADAPASGIEASSLAVQYPDRATFMNWLYGDNVDGPQVTQSALSSDMYAGHLDDRINRTETWPTTPASTRLLTVLRELRAEGFENLREVHEGFNPSSRPAPPPTPDPYVRPALRPEPATHTDEVKAIVLAPMTAAQTTAKGKLNTLSKSLMRALSDTPDVLRRDVRTAWKGAIERVFSAVVNKVDRFRYGTLSAATLAHPTIQGIVADLNAYQRSIGSDMEIGVFEASSNFTPATRMGVSVSIKVRHGNGRWFQGISTQFGPNGYGSGATVDQAGENPSQQQRQPSDGGYAYYLQHLINHYVPGAGSSSGSMWQVNQLRRNENALSFMARYAATPALNPTTISFDLGMEHGHGSSFTITGGESPIGALATRAYNRILQMYPELSRYTFDFATGEVKFGSTVIPVSALVGHARLVGNLEGDARRRVRSIHEAQPHVGRPDFEADAFSEPTFLRALITQEVLKTKSTSRATAATPTSPAATSVIVPSATKMRRITDAIAANRGFTDIIFYNRTPGEAIKSKLQATTLSKTLQPTIEALKHVAPVQVIQTQAHLPGWQEGMPSFNAAYHNGTIYVVADQVQSAAEAKALILDHELRHAGLRQVLGKQFDTFLKQAWFSQKNEIKGFANSKGIDTASVQGRLEAAEEYIVSLANEAKSTPLLDRAIAKIRGILRALGIDLTLSRAELRAMVARAAVVTERVGSDGVTRFARADGAQTQLQLAQENLNTFGKEAVRRLGQASNYVAQALMPIDRLISYAKNKAEYKIIQPLLERYYRLQNEKQARADSISGMGFEQYEKVRKLAGSNAMQDKFNAVMRDGTLMGMFPERTLAEQPWTEETWAEKNLEKFGPLAEAHAGLSERYAALGAVEGLQQAYLNTVKIMKDLREQEKGAVKALVIKTTPETTLENATSFKAANGRIVIATQDNVSGLWEARRRDGTLVATGASKAEATAGMEPRGKREEMLAKVDERFASIKGHYAPLSRFGDISLEVFEPGVDPATGEATRERVGRWHFETEADFRAMRETFAQENPAYELIRHDASQVLRNQRAEVPAEFMVAIDEHVAGMGLDESSADELRDALTRVWVQLTPENTTRKHGLKRLGLAGFDEDMMRGFQEYTNKMGRSIADLTLGVPMRETLRDMDKAIADEEARGTVEGAKEARKMVDHLKTHATRVANDQINPVVSALKKWTSVWYLASPSVLLVQSSQPFVHALPNLAVKYGYMKSMKMITNHYRQQLSKSSPYANDKLDRFMATAEQYIDRVTAGLPTDTLTSGLSPADLRLLGMAIETKRGGIDITLSHEGRAVSAGETKNWKDRAAEKAMWAMKVSEVMSRKATFAATFDLEMARSGDFAKATDMGHKVVTETLFDYGHANRPGWLLGNVGGLLGQFQIFRVHTLSRLFQLSMDSLKGASAEERKAAQKELGMMLGNVVLISGLSGLPIPAVAISALSMMFGDDDEPWDMDVWMRGKLGEGVIADMMLKGGLAGLGLDISKRTGMNGIFELFNGDAPAGARGGQLFNYYAGKAFGPTGGIVNDLFFKLPQLAKNGQWGDVVQQSTPKPLKDLKKGYDIAFGSGVYSGSGKLVIDSADMTVWDAVIATVGVNPLNLSNAQEKSYGTQKISASITARKSDLTKALQRAVVDDDPDAIDDAVQKMEAFSAKMPAFAFTRKTMAQSIVAAKRKELGLPDKQAEKVEAYISGG